MTVEIPQALEINCETGAVITRDLTADEITQRDADAAAYAAQVAADEAAAAALDVTRQSAVTKLMAGTPLDANEASLIARAIHRTA